jgi:hypothetical protein
MAPAPAPPQLDLSALTSYSPAWPHTLRFALCIATQYSARRCVERVRALQPEGAEAAEGDDSDEEDDDEGNVKRRLQGWAQERVRRKRRELVEDWEDYSARVSRIGLKMVGLDAEHVHCSSSPLCASTSASPRRSCRVSLEQAFLTAQQLMRAQQRERRRSQMS